MADKHEVAELIQEHYNYLKVTNQEEEACFETEEGDMKYSQYEKYNENKKENETIGVLCLRTKPNKNLDQVFVQSKVLIQHAYEYFKHFIEVKFMVNDQIYKVDKSSTIEHLQQDENER